VSQNREVIISFNPRAGSGSGKPLILELKRLLLDYGYDVQLIDSLSTLASYSEGQGDRIHAVVAAGGDGTIEAVVNATNGKLPVATFPLGTENLLAKYLKIEAHPRRMVEIISLGRTVQFDAGTANGKLFTIMLSCGFDAEVVRRVHAERKGNITHLAYAKPIVQSIWNYNYPDIVVEWMEDGKWKKQSCHWAFVFNAPTYAAGLRIVSDADPTDGHFEIATFTGGSFWHGILQFSAVAVRQQKSLPSFQLHRSNHIRIRSDRDDVAFQFDGDPGGFLPVEVQVLPKHLTMLVDQDFTV